MVGAIGFRPYPLNLFKHALQLSSSPAEGHAGGPSSQTSSLGHFANTLKKGSVANRSSAGTSPELSQLWVAKKRKPATRLRPINFPPLSITGSVLKRTPPSPNTAADTEKIAAEYPIKR